MATTPRVVSMDAYRGIVMLVLMPNPYSAWGVRRMAEQDPASAFWQVMDRLFTHVAWTGLSVWDMVMPSFLLLMGAAIPFSNAARAARGEPPGWAMQHAAIRAAAFVLLGMLLSIRPANLLQEAAPLLLLAALALPWPERVTRALALEDRAAVHRLRIAGSAGVLALAALQLALSLRDPGIHHTGNVLVQAGLAWLPACWIATRSRRAQWGWALGLLAVWWLAFLLHPLPAAGTDLTRLAVAPGDEHFDGLWAHWNKNTNLASALDTWVFEHLPRSTPFEPSSHGYQMFNFVPTIASIVFGVLAGGTIREAASAAAARTRLLRNGALLVAAGALAALTVCPLVKSIWTPSFALFSGGLATLALGLLHEICEVRGARRWALPFVMIGSNAMLLYVLSYYPWRLLGPWRALLGPGLATGPWAPLIESACMALTLTALAALLARRRILLRV